MQPPRTCTCIRVCVRISVCVCICVCVYIIRVHVWCVCTCVRCTCVPPLVARSSQVPKARGGGKTGGRCSSTGQYPSHYLPGTGQPGTRGRQARRAVPGERMLAVLQYRHGSRPSAPVAASASTLSRRCHRLGEHFLSARPRWLQRRRATIGQLGVERHPRLTEPWTPPCPPPSSGAGSIFLFRAPSPGPGPPAQRPRAASPAHGSDVQVTQLYRTAYNVSRPPSGLGGVFFFCFPGSPTSPFSLSSASDSHRSLQMAAALARASHSLPTPLGAKDTVPLGPAWSRWPPAANPAVRTEAKRWANQAHSWNNGGRMGM